MRNTATIRGVDNYRVVLLLDSPSFPSTHFLNSVLGRFLIYRGVFLHPVSYYYSTLQIPESISRQATIDER
jgi:hypothetical protein